MERLRGVFLILDNLLLENQLMTRHFLSLMDLTADELHKLVYRAIELKREFKAGVPCVAMKGKTLALIFDKSSTRTRVSFEVAASQLGGNSLFLSPSESQLGRGEPLEDTAKVLSGMVDVVVIRTGGHEKIETFASHSSIPVINGLTDLFHPCQILADIQTYVEHRGEIRGKRVAWIGDGNNVCHSWMNAARQLGFDLQLAIPPGYEPDKALLENCQSQASLSASPVEAVEGADLVVTDVWASMGQESERTKRLKAFEGYQVDPMLMSHASENALFMHCLPAYRGFEVSAEVIDGPQSVVWDEAHNRLHAQKALLEYLLN